MMNKRNIGKSLLCGLVAFTMMTGCGKDIDISTLHKNYRQGKCIGSCVKAG